MQFDFGENWRRFSEEVLNNESVLQAKRDFFYLMEGIELQNKSFLDIGFGQGLSLLIAATMGAKIVGCEISPKCADVLNRNLMFFPEIAGTNIPVIIGSILEGSTVEKLRKSTPDGDWRYDIVHSWGVLHHTGNMKLAIKNTAGLVKEDGFLILSLYNRHWSSSIWLMMKWLYCKSPESIKRVMIALLYPVIWIAKLLITGKNPKKQSRGMDFFYNIIDWVGGYPYEYASVLEIEDLLAELGFGCTRKIPAQVPTGCNEFVFYKKSRQTA